MNPLLFIIVMEEAAKEHRKEGTWKLLFADDLVLIAESREEVLKMFQEENGNVLKMKERDEEVKVKDQHEYNHIQEILSL